MRNISVALTIPQIKARTKRVTRRAGWGDVFVGDLLQTCEKCQGLKPGQQLVKLAVIRITSIRRESLWRLIDDEAYGRAEAALEGFPSLSGREFATLFAKANQISFHKVINRFEFEYVE